MTAQAFLLDCQRRLVVRLCYGTLPFVIEHATIFSRPTPHSDTAKVPAADHICGPCSACLKWRDASLDFTFIAGSLECPAQQLLVDIASIDDNSSYGAHVTLLARKVFRYEEHYDASFHRACEQAIDAQSCASLLPSPRRWQTTTEKTRAAYIRVQS